MVVAPLAIAPLVAALLTFACLGAKTFERGEEENMLRGLGGNQMHVSLKENVFKKRKQRETHNYYKITSFNPKIHHRQQIALSITPRADLRSIRQTFNNSSIWHAGHPIWLKHQLWLKNDDAHQVFNFSFASLNTENTSIIRDCENTYASPLDFLLQQSSLRPLFLKMLTKTIRIRKA